MGSLGEYRKSEVKSLISVDETTDMALFVRTSDEDMVVWNRQRIVDALVREAYVDPATAEEISKEVQDQIVASKTSLITAPLVRELVNGVIQNKERIDLNIKKFAPAWPIEQIPVVDRNILRLAIFEILLDNKVSVKVSINEAVELAKTFGSDNSSKFINGVLGSVSGLVNR